METLFYKKKSKFKKYYFTTSINCSKYQES